MSFLLMLFLTLVCLAVGNYESWLPLTPWQSTWATMAAIAVVGLHAFWVSRRVSWPLSRDPSRRDVLLFRYERGRFVHQIVQFGVFLFALLILGWGWAVQQLWAWPGSNPPAALPGLELWILFPFLAGQALTLLFFYDADRAAFRAAHRLVDGDPFSQAWLESRQALPTFGGRWSYVVFQMRQRFALVFILVLLLTARNELGRWFGEDRQGVLNFVAIAGLAGVMVCMPLVIRFALGLRPLPPGDLRDRLLAAMKRLGFRCTDVLLWNTRSGMANAMVVGLVPWLRYVVFTDKLLEEFTEDEVEAVFGHEVGHIRHHHMLLYLVFLMTSIVMLGLATEYYLLPMFGWSGQALAAQVGWLPPEWAGVFGPCGKLAPLPMVAVMVGYVLVVFGYLSRRCERQADVFGCRAVSCTDPACEGHDEETTLPPRGRGLCPTGIYVFIQALEKVALINGISRDRPGFLQSWQHSTIARRVAFLRRMMGDERVEPAFQRRLWVMKAVLLAGTVALLGVLVFVHGWRW